MPWWKRLPERRNVEYKPCGQSLKQKEHTNEQKPKTGKPRTGIPTDFGKRLRLGFPHASMPTALVRMPPVSIIIMRACGGDWRDLVRG